MKNLLLLLTLGFSTMTQAFTQDEQAIIDLYREMNTEMVAANTDALDKMLTPDYTLTHMTGYKQSRAEWLAQVKSGEMDYFSTKEVSVTPTVQGDHAQLTGRAITAANIWGIRGTWGLQLIIDYEKHNGKWLMSKAVASSFAY